MESQSLTTKVGEWILTPTGLIITVLVVGLIWWGDKNKGSADKLFRGIFKTIFLLGSLVWAGVWIYWLVTSLLSFNLLSFVTAFVFGGIITGIVGLVFSSIIS